MQHDNELWQKFDENGERIPGGHLSSLGNPEEESEYFVGSVLIWIYRQTDSGVEVLFQKRSPQVSHNPNKWDVAAGGHINDSEGIVEAAIRESREEIGIKIDLKKLRYVFSTRATNGINLYIHDFIYDYTGQTDNFNFNDQEVSEVKWVNFSDFDKFIDAYAKDSLKNGKFTRSLVKMFIERYGNSK